MATNRTVLVTGAAGFIGSHLVERLLSRGDRVIGLDNFDNYYSPVEKRQNLATALKDSRFQLVEGSCEVVSDLEKLRSSPAPDVIVHLAARPGVRPSIADPTSYYRTNVIGTQNMLAFAQGLGIRRFVFGSSSSVYGNSAPVPFSESDAAGHPISPYAASKRAGELVCHAHQHLHGGSIIALRFFTVYGPRQRPDLAIRKFTSLILKSEPIPFYGDGSTERDYTWIDDIIDGVVGAIDRTASVPDEFEIINLGGHQTTSLSKLLTLISGAAGREYRLNRMPMQPGDVMRTYADVTKAGRLLGYAPRTSIDEGIRRFVAWMKS